MTLGMHRFIILSNLASAHIDLKANFLAVFHRWTASSFDWNAEGAPGAQGVLSRTRPLHGEWPAWFLHV